MGAVVLLSLALPCVADSGGTTATTAEAGAPPLLTLHAPVLAAACSGGCQPASATPLAPAVLAMPLHAYEYPPGGQATALSTDGGSSFRSVRAAGIGATNYPSHVWRAANTAWGGSDSPPLLVASPNVRYDNGYLEPQPGNTSCEPHDLTLRGPTFEFWPSQDSPPAMANMLVRSGASANRTRYEWDGRALHATTEQRAVTFRGLPRPAVAPPAGRFLPTGFLPGNMIRMSGTAVVALGGGRWLRTAIVRPLPPTVTSRPLPPCRPLPPALGCVAQPSAASASAMRSGLLRRQPARPRRHNHHRLHLPRWTNLALHRHNRSGEGHCRREHGRPERA